MAKKKRVGEWFGMGLGVSVAVYLLGHLLLAALAVKGVVEEGSCFPVTAVLCALSSLCGAAVTVGRTRIMADGIVAALLFCGVLIAVGAVWWREIAWMGHGVILLACALGGGVTAGYLLRRKKRRR